ncbi:histidine phosphatase family protein [Sulfurovum sp.]|jgi:phosphohistidine phosphatase|uniref:SixA phosphatase family protein n=1 Tax=Sulfurovum sp. TaxID=1969726 RepID=UPI002A36A97F|nr:histidine phosphatase family protein [Sulfurovum sp.]MDD2451331.1 histidine phosphatase family protein [Sulfurovum sp.]MDD3499751.1 histidine phosphatase family protein [Sulfurovum sp.]MDY0402401.1 histidine phosphatase family protein [Sulfurovum sp.]
MKRLYLIRHAKSDWSDPSQSDFERGLNKRGKKNIIRMANALKTMEIKPDLIISSSAKRAKKTAKGLAKQLGYKEDIMLLDRLYMCEPQEWIETIQNIPEQYRSVFIIGHNPEITDVVNHLIDDYIDNIPTLGIVGFDVAAQKWDKFEHQSAKFSFFIYPNMDL